MKLFCIPGAGASSVMFLPWVKQLRNNEEITPCLLEIPGRGIRKKDEPVDTIDQLVDVLLKKISIQVQEGEGYALYGYCFGAIVAYEMIRKLKKNGGKMPDYFFISSIGAPDNAKIAEPVFSNESFRDEVSRMFVRYFPEQLFCDTKNLDLVTKIFTEKVFDDFRTTGKLSPVPIEVFKKQKVQGLECESELERIVAFANDALMVFEYDQKMLLQYTAEKREKCMLPCTCMALRGEHDSLTTMEDLTGWNSYCDKPLKMVTVEGNHFTFEESREEILNAMLEVMRTKKTMTILDI